MNRIPELAKYVQEFEGWELPSYKNFWRGSISFRQNNPGNLRYSFYQSGVKGGYSYFKDYETGRKALIHQLTIIANGTSPAYNRAAKDRGWKVKNSSELSLIQVFQIYAPSSDGNHPLKYAAFLAGKIGVSPTVQVKSLLA